LNLGDPLEQGMEVVMDLPATAAGTDCELRFKQMAHALTGLFDTPLRIAQRFIPSHGMSIKIHTKN
jgi:hypothetical protein